MNKERVAKWDNIKFFMMASVVIGHTIYNFTGSSELAKSLYLFIYTYHMPVFIFLVGLFSKNTIREKRYERVLEYLFVYMVMKFLDSFGHYLLGTKLRFHFFWEDGPAWFALAMAVFLIVTMILKDIDPRYLLGFAFFIGCVAGLDNHLGDHFASMRICVFYPIFLLGYYMDADVLRLKKLSRGTKLLVGGISFLFINAILILCILKGEELFPYIKLLKGKFPYEDMGYSLEGILMRILTYGLCLLMIAAVICVNIDKRSLITWLGSRTMSIFIWHNLLITIIFKRLGLKIFLKTNMPHYYLFAAICVAMIITILSAYLPEIRLPIKTDEPLYDAETGERLR